MKTLYSLPSLRLSRWRLYASLQFKPADMWVGVFWQNYPGKVYVWVCIVPCLPLHLEIWKPGTGWVRLEAEKYDKRPKVPDTGGGLPGEINPL